MILHPSETLRPHFTITETRTFFPPSCKHLAPLGFMGQMDDKGRVQSDCNEDLRLVTVTQRSWEPIRKKKSEGLVWTGSSFLSPEQSFDQGLVWFLRDKGVCICSGRCTLTGMWSSNLAENASQFQKFEEEVSVEGDFSHCFCLIRTSICEKTPQMMEKKFFGCQDVSDAAATLGCK